jgi:endonuclease/exonuclease/phosphatase family metal-dependent hydrolase
MENTLRVGTLNVWALPVVARRVEERLRAIVARAAALDLDLLALQEVWTPRAESVLIEAGAAAGYRSLWPSGRGAGGLMALSRLEATSVEFTEFAVGGLPQRVQHADYYGQKGYVLAQLSLGNETVALLVTHLHARYAAPGERDEYLGIRASQIAELIGRVSGLRCPIVAVGDFNVREGEPEYECLLGLTGLVDTAAFVNARQATVVAANPYVGAGHHGDERIDYVFVNEIVKPVAVGRDFDEPPGRYSDHAGVVATIELPDRQAANAAPPSADRYAAAQLARLLDDGRSMALRRRRQHRLRATGLLAGAVLGWTLRSRVVAGLLLTWALAESVLAERFVPNELRGLDFARGIVDGQAGSAGAQVSSLM